MSQRLAGDQVGGRSGLHDFGWMQTVGEAGLTAIGEGTHLGVASTAQSHSERARLMLIADPSTAAVQAQRTGAPACQSVNGAEQEVDRHTIHLDGPYYCERPDERRSRSLNGWPNSPTDCVMSWNRGGDHGVYSAGQGCLGVNFAGAVRPAEADALLSARQPQPAVHRARYGRSGQLPHYVRLPWIKRCVRVGSCGTSPESCSLPTQLANALAQDSGSPVIRDRSQSMRDTDCINAWLWVHE